MRTLVSGCVLLMVFGFAGIAGDVFAEEPARPSPNGEVDEEDAAAAKEAAQPASPLKNDSMKKGARPGWVQLSDDTVLKGAIVTSMGKALPVFNRDKKEYVRPEWKDVARIEVEVESATREQVWRWKEGGSDIKVYVDKFYIWHKYLSTVTLKNGDTIEGDLAAPIYLTKEKSNTPQIFVFHKRNKSDQGTRTAVKPPLYIKRLVLTDVEGADPPPVIEKAIEENSDEEGEAADNDQPSDDTKAKGDQKKQEKEKPKAPDKSKK